MKGKDMGQLDGKTAVVTGGNSGIGLATAARFAEEGARVFVAARRKPELDAAIEAIGSNAVGVEVDVADPESLDRLYAAVENEGRRIDVLFANAGGGELVRLEDATPEHVDWILDTNVKGTLFTVQKALPLLNDGASVILTSSTAASSGAEAFGVYAATKAAIRSFARTWANELKGCGIRVNAVSPGPVDTPGVDGLAGDDTGRRQLKDGLASATVFGRMGRPEEVANVVVFLGSDQSTFMTGGEIFVDGGLGQI
jgi:NAD(P)-dependent dehydrogenase (short-subunit alcohol dehydrogenase family)